MDKLLKQRNSIYGVLAIWVVVFHIFRRISMPFIPVVTNIIGIGNIAVDFFFFFSGLCLSLSANRNDYQTTGWKKYFSKRLVRIIIPYFIICIPYYVWEAIYESADGVVHKMIVFAGNLSSASFWLYGNQTTWYVYGILVFYMLFPLLYSCILKMEKKYRFALIAAMIIISIIISYVPIIKNSILVWTRLPIFTIGIMKGTSKDKINNKTLYRYKIILTISILLLLGTLVSISEISSLFNIPQVYRLLLYIPMVLSAVFLLSNFSWTNKFLARIGELSLEIYLVHITILHPLKYYGVLDSIGFWIYFVLPILSVLISVLVGNLEKIIIKRLECKC